MSKAKVMGLPASANSMGAWLCVSTAMGDNAEFEACNIMEGAHQTPEFGAINPFRQIPAFVDTDGTGMGEANAIIMYAASKYAPAMLNVEAGPNAIWGLEAAVSYIYSGGWSDTMYPCFGFVPDPEDFTAPREKLLKNLATYAETFLKGKFVGGDNLCVADFRLAALCEPMVHPHVKAKAGFECPERYVTFLKDFKEACPAAGILTAAGGFSIKEWLDGKMA